MKLYKIYPNQLDQFFLKNKISNFYFLYGNEDLFIQECEDKICAFAKKKGFFEKFKFFIDKNTNWKLILNILQKKSLFSKRQILLLKIFNERKTTIEYEKLLEILKFLHKDIILIVSHNKLINLKNFSQKKIIIIPCMKIKKEKIFSWISNQAKKMGFFIEKNANNLLCQFYENNLYALIKILEKINFFYKKKKVTVSFIHNMINDDSYFNVFHLLDSLLLGDIKRSFRILYRMKKQDKNLYLIITRILQKEVTLLILIKRKYYLEINKVKYHEYGIWKNREFYFKTALKRLTYKSLFQIAYILSYLENKLYRENKIEFFWMYLESISILFCKKNF